MRRRVCIGGEEYRREETENENDTEDNMDIAEAAEQEAAGAVRP